MQTISIEQRERSDRVTAASSIADLRLRDIRAELKVPTPRLPLSLEHEIIPTMVRLDDGVVYHVTYKLEALSSNDRLVLEAQVTMSVVFVISDPKLSQADLQAFGMIGVLDIVHPYVREIVHNLTSRMGLPPLVLDVKVPPIMLPLS